MERARFPMEFLRVTQGPNTGSHAGSKAMDFGGKDTGCDAVYAPFPGRRLRGLRGARRLGRRYIRA